MEVIPAIDLRGGKVVRLHQGDYAQQTTFSDDPLGVARQFAGSGAPRIHVVDLDGALGGMPTHLETAHAIAAAVPVPIEFGGGIRTAEALDAALSGGVDRVVLGTAAVEQPGLIEEWLRRHGPRRIVVGLDARDGLIAVSGWTSGTSVKATELMERMASIGARLFSYTDIARDGTLTAPNFQAAAEMQTLAQRLGCAIIVGGGVGDLSHLQRLAAIGVDGAIVGSAIYRGAIDLAEAVALVEGPP